MPMYDSNLPWKEKRKIIQADIDKKKKELKTQREQNSLMTQLKKAQVHLLQEVKNQVGVVEVPVQEPKAGIKIQ